MGHVLPYVEIARTTLELHPQRVLHCLWLRAPSATADKQLIYVQSSVQETGKERQLSSLVNNWLPVSKIAENGNTPVELCAMVAIWVKCVQPLISSQWHLTKRKRGLTFRITNVLPQTVAYSLNQSFPQRVIQNLFSSADVTLVKITGLIPPVSIWK